MQGLETPGTPSMDSILMLRTTWSMSLARLARRCFIYRAVFVLNWSYSSELSISRDYNSWLVMHFALGQRLCKVCISSSLGGFYNPIMTTWCPYVMKFSVLNIALRLLAWVIPLKSVRSSRSSYYLIMTKSVFFPNLDTALVVAMNWSRVPPMTNGMFSLWMQRPTLELSFSIKSC